MQRCSCGAILKPQAKFCTHCGKSLLETAPKPAANYCTKTGCKYQTIELASDDYYCPECGSFTIRGKKHNDLI